MFELLKRTKTSIQVQKDRPIVFISDLHFDFIQSKPVAEEVSYQLESEFVSFVKEHYRDHLLCLAGDYYDDYRKTIAMCE